MENTIYLYYIIFLSNKVIMIEIMYKSIIMHVGVIVIVI